MNILKRKKSLKYLVIGMKNYSGINNLGRKTILKGTRKKKKYRLIDYYRNFSEIEAVVIKIEYDPNRSAYIALICYKNGFLSYIIAAEGLKKGMVVNSIDKIKGSAYMLKDISLGSFISCLEVILNKGAKIARSAGTFCILISQIDNYNYLVKFPSGKEKLIFKYNKAMLGVISNKKHHLVNKSKAGCNIRLGRKPHVRGVAKNCIDHPNGGGRGKTSQWSDCPNFTRRVLKFVKTRKKKRC